MPYITKQFTYDIPDKWQEQETTLGKTSTQTYTGPDKVVSFVQNGRVVSTHNKDKDDGRPCPADWEPVEIDCDQMPLHCGILWGGLVPPTHYEVEVGPADRLNPTIADPTHPSAPAARTPRCSQTCPCRTCRTRPSPLCRASRRRR